ncbi:hypothetical protein DH2020_033297 [Rehmannia glutinosa]|uniref:HMA domain-containing protein n=1 Tax=Rehmannia glutinosa TaxID=99300 RepID=A0ABR0VF95_REHGL
MRMLEVLGSICGQYNIDINTEEGLVRVYALVDPNILMKALARTGYHAEVKWVKLSHPKLNRNYYQNDYDSYNYQHGYNYGAIDDPYSYRRALPDPISYPSHQYPATRSISPYYHGLDPYYYGSGLPPASKSFRSKPVGEGEERAHPDVFARINKSPLQMRNMEFLLFITRLKRMNKSEEK